jgi:hypothetical protein
MLEGKQSFSYSMRLKSQINGFLPPSPVMPACAGMTWIFGGRRPTSASLGLGQWPRQRQRSRLKEVFLLLFLQKKKVFLNA